MSEDMFAIEEPYQEEVIDTPIIPPKVIPKQNPIKKPGKPKPTLFSLEFKNQFYTWVQSLNPYDYPLQKSIILQVQKYNKRATFEYVLQLFQAFLER